MVLLANCRGLKIKLMSNWILSLELILIILIGVAFITLAERKLMGSMQRRIGPSNPNLKFGGIIQPILDGIKLFLKELIIPKHSNKTFILGPIFSFILSLMVWVTLPISNFNFILFENSYGILYIFAISSVTIFILLFSGWNSNSKFTFLGSVRAIAQLISYEVSLGIIVLSVIFLNQDFNFYSILFNQIYSPYLFPLFPLFLLFIISAIAETNRPPFDLPEAESELVAGLLTEFSAISFAFLYLAEYSFLFSISLICSILFLGNSIYTFFIIFLFIWVRSSLPRVRYDQLMSLCWTQLLPFSVSYFIFVFSFFFLFN